MQVNINRSALIQARRAKGLNLTQIAAAIGVSEGTVYKVEAGYRDPRFDTLILWARVLGRPTDDFVTVTDGEAVAS